jgi:phenylacetate-CoA ligase
MIKKFILQNIFFKKRLQILKKKQNLYKNKNNTNEIHLYQIDQFNKVWSNAINNIPFYEMWRSKYNLPYNVTSLEEISNFPILTKKDIQENHELIFSHLRKPNTISTGGSTGEPTSFPTSKNEIEISYANHYLGRGWWDIKPLDNILLFWGHSHLFGTGIKGVINKFKRRLYDSVINTHRLSAYDMSSETLHKHLQKLGSSNPTMILGYTSSINKISKYLQKNNIQIINTDNLRGVVVTSETVTQYDIDMVESVFKAPCILEYGMAETGVIAYSKEKTSNIKVFWDSFLCQKTFENQLLVSTLTDKLFPLINYDTGDIIDSSDNKSILTLHKIIGRSNDFITIFDEGQRKIIHSEFFTHVLKSIPSILDFRIKQKLDLSIVVSYVCSDTKEISQTFYTEVKKEYKNIQINQFSFFKVSFIPPTKSGKAKWIEVEK